MVNLFPEEVCPAMVPIPRMGVVVFPSASVACLILLFHGVNCVNRALSVIIVCDAPESINILWHGVLLILLTVCNVIYLCAQ